MPWAAEVTVSSVRLGNCMQHGLELGVYGNPRCVAVACALPSAMRRRGGAAVTFKNLL